VAIKILHPEMSLNEVVRQRFLREGYVANSVGHDGAVKVSDDDIGDDGGAFLVMELLDGETLEERRIRAGGNTADGLGGNNGCNLSCTSAPGTAGSGGQPGKGTNGGNAGGGGAAGGGCGGSGAVRVVWSGASRAFPTTNVGAP
jgi:hypothetical protein